MMITRALGAAVCCSLIARSDLSGQVARGRIVLPDGTASAPGIVITATEQNGRVVGSAMTGPSGSFVLRLPAVGRYNLRILRIGYRATVVDGVDVNADTVQLGDVILNPLPVTIAGVEIRDRADCDLSGRAGDIFIQLWDQARAALTSAQLGERSGALNVHLIRIEGGVDAMKWHAPKAIGNPTAELDSAQAREWVADHALTAVLPETLSAQGYVRRPAAGGVVYDVPTADALLSEDFLGGHCFSVVKAPAARPSWIGVGFVPRTIRDGVVDVEGVLWLDRASAELRRLEFEYRNMPREAHVLCEGEPFMDSPDKANRICRPYAESDSRSFGTGGDADFHRLASGEWLTTKWTVRTVGNEWNLRPTGEKVRHLSPQEKCSSRAVSEAAKRRGDCVNIWTSVPRLSVVSTEILRVFRAGVEVYRNDAAIAASEAVAKRRAGKHPAHLDGRISDEAGRPLRNAVVQIEKPSRVEITDSLGAFRIRHLPPGPVVISVRCQQYRGVRFTLPLLPDSTRRVSGALLSDSTSTRPSTNCHASER